MLQQCMYLHIVESKRHIKFAIQKLPQVLKWGTIFIPVVNWILLSFHMEMLNSQNNVCSHRLDIFL